MWEHALEIASRLTHPISLAAFSSVISAFLFALAVKSKRQRISQMFYAVLPVIAFLGITPLIATTYVQSQGIYHVRILVFGPDGKSVSNATVTSSGGGEIKKASGTWELDIPPQTLPANRRLTVSATLESDFLAKSREVDLEKDYFQTVKITLEPLPPVIVRGVVLDERRRLVVGASISIEGYPEIAPSNEMGNFEIPARKARGQMVTVTAKKLDLYGQKSGPAGEGFELILTKP